MKNFLLHLSLLVLPVYGQQAHFTWIQDTLRLTAPAESATSVWSEYSDVSHNAFWQMTVCMDFTSSSANYAVWYLMADSNSLHTAPNACFVRLGQTAHQVELCLREAGKIRKLIVSDADVLVASQPLTVCVSRQGAVWSLFLPQSGWQVSASDAGVCGSVAWGMVCTYTKTRSQGFRFCHFQKMGDPCEPLPIPDFRQIRITEVLSQPVAGGADYVEIHNLSENDFSLGELLLSNGRSTKALPDDTLTAGSYCVLTRDSAWVCGNYLHSDATAVRVMPDLPALTAASGTVFLLHEKGTIVDSLRYDQSLFGMLVTQPQGVAYELDEDDGEAVGAASCDGGCGSPGLPNTFRVAAGKTTVAEQESDEISLEPEVLRTGESMHIRLSFGESVLLRVAVYDLTGRLQYLVYGNELITGPCEAVWDGLDQRGRQLPPGIYVLHAEAVAESGRVIRKKIPFVLSPIR